MQLCSDRQQVLIPSKIFQAVILFEHNLMNEITYNALTLTDECMHTHKILGLDISARLSLITLTTTISTTTKK